MKLTEKQIQQLQERLKEYSLECAVCSEGKYSVSDHVFKLDNFDNSSVYRLPPPGPILPVIPLICNECGHITFFSALALGVISAEEEKDGKKQ